MWRYFVLIALLVSKTSFAGKNIDKILEDLAANVAIHNTGVSEPSQSLQGTTTINSGYSQRLNKILNSLNELEKDVDKLQSEIIKQRMSYEEKLVAGSLVRITLQYPNNFLAGIIRINLSVNSDEVFSFSNPNGIVFPPDGLASLFVQHLPKGEYKLTLSVYVQPLPSQKKEIRSTIVQRLSKEFPLKISDSRDKRLNIVISSRKDGEYQMNLES